MPIARETLQLGVWMVCAMTPDELKAIEQRANLLKARSLDEIEYRCTSGHDLCFGGISAGSECQYCDRICTSDGELFYTLARTDTPALLAEVKAQAEKIKGLEAELKGFCAVHDASLDGVCPCCEAVHQNDLLKESERRAAQKLADIAAERDALATRIAEITEPYIDERDTNWNFAPAWAYAMVCRARDKWQARTEAAERARDEAEKRLAEADAVIAYELISGSASDVPPADETRLIREAVTRHRARQSAAAGTKEAGAILDCLSAEDAYDWLQERLQNARGIAATKTGAERDGWIEDAAYFAAAAAFVVAHGDRK